MDILNIVPIICEKLGKSGKKPSVISYASWKFFHRKANHCRINNWQPHVSEIQNIEISSSVSHTHAHSSESIEE